MMRANKVSGSLLLCLVLIAGCKKETRKATVTEDAKGQFDATPRVYIKSGQILEWDAGEGVQSKFFIFFKGDPPCEGVGTNEGKKNNFVGEKNSPATCKVKSGLPRGSKFEYDISPAPLEMFDEGPGHCKGCVYDTEE
jgi:hypothetical protein